MGVRAGEMGGGGLQELCHCLGDSPQRQITSMHFEVGSPGYRGSSCHSFLLITCFQGPLCATPVASVGVEVTKDIGRILTLRKLPVELAGGHHETTVCTNNPLGFVKGMGTVWGANNGSREREPPEQVTSGRSVSTRPCSNHKLQWPRSP